MASLIETRRNILMSSPHLTSASGQLATFNTDLSAPLKEMKVHFSPVQASGTPSPDNVLPISGWDGVTVTKCGKNLLGGSAIVQAIANSNSTAVVNGDEVTFRAVSATHTTPIFEKFKPNTQYTFIITGYKSQSNAYINLAVEYTDGTSKIIVLPVGFTLNETYTIVLVTTANKTVKCFRNHAANYQDFTLTGSSSGIFEGVLTADDYEPYTAQSIPITFPQTIYGGYVDLVKGEVVEDTHYTVLDGENIKVNRSYFNSGVNTGYVAAGYVYCNPSGKNRTVYYCDKLTRIATGGAITSTTPIPILRYANAGSLFVVIVLGKMEDYPDVTTGNQAIAAVNEWLKNNPVAFTYKLATPNIYPLTIQALKTLKGINNIFSDANGNVDVTYWTH